MRWYKIKKIICGVYSVTNTLTGKQYIGQSRNCLRRWGEHRSKSINPSKKDEHVKPLYVAIRKYGLENFTFEVLEECNEEILKDREIYWVNKLDTYNNGYNSSPGGDLPSEEIIHVGEEHGMAKLKEEDVIKCRFWYAEGKSAREIHEKYYKDIVTFPGFQRMWHGKTWKHVMPETFNFNPRPAKKVTEEHIKDIRNRYDNGEKICHISKSYKGILGHATVHNIAKRNTYKY